MKYKILLVLLAASILGTVMPAQVSATPTPKSSVTVKGLHPAPTGVKVKITKTTVVISWAFPADIDGIASYLVEVAATAKGPWRSAKILKETYLSRTIKVVKTEGKSYIRVTAKFADGGAGISKAQLITGTA